MTRRLTTTRDRLQVNRTPLAWLDVVAAIAGVVAICAVWVLEYNTDLQFHLVEALFAISILLLVLAAALSAVQRSRGFQMVAILLALELLLAAASNWLLCWMAGLGGLDCWWIS